MSLLSETLSIFSSFKPVVRPYVAHWPDVKLVQLRDRLRAYDFPRMPKDAGWNYGCDPDYLRDFCTYWSDEYDTDLAQEELNKFPQFIAEVEKDVKIHFVHVRGEAAGRRVLLLAHGWPSSVLEFWPAVERLAYPTRFGGSVGDAFDIVIPTLPGFGASFKPTEPVGPKLTARWYHKLMTEALGYPHYHLHGTDLGAAVVPLMAINSPNSVAGLHVHHSMARSWTPNAEELTWQRAVEKKEQEMGGYRLVQSTHPSSLAYAMHDNPVAQAAWFLERFHDWSDLRHRTLDQALGRDWMIHTIMTYLMNDSFTTALWYYVGAAKDGLERLPSYVKSPTGFTAFPDPRLPHPPRSLIEKEFNLVHWSTPERGGHFAAVEDADAFVREIREWARRT